MSLIVENAATLVRTGLLRPEHPRKFIGAAKAQRKWDRTPAGGVASNAVRHGDKVCLVDEAGTVSHAELHDHTNRLANALAASGVRAGDGVGVLCRDHRYFVYALIASSKLGADALLLNTSFSAPQLRDVVAREGVAAVIHDKEFSELLPEGVTGFVAWEGEGEGSVDQALADCRLGRAGGPGSAGSADPADVGHDRDAEGRAPAAVDAAGRDPRLPRARSVEDGRLAVRGVADVPRVGLCAPRARVADGRPDRAAATVRSRADARDDRASTASMCCRSCP